MSKKVLTLILGSVTLYLAVLAAASLNWRMMHDSIMVMYPVFIMDRLDLMPYRDFFEVNLPGTLLVYDLAGRLGGYGDLGFRLFDLFWLAATMAAVYQWLRPAGRHAGWAGAVGIGLAYLQGGPIISLERDFFMLLPIVAAILLLRGDRKTLARAVAAGACFGFVAMVKPQTVLFLPPVWFFHLYRRDRAETASVSRRAGSAAMVAGFGIPVALSVLWMAWNHALMPFFEMASNYYPLYGRFFENRIVLDPIQRLNIIVNQMPKLGGHALWLIPAGLGIHLSLDHPRGSDARALALTITALILVALVLPAITGQFFPYHWLPLQFFAIVGAALCLGETPATRDRLARLFPVLVFLAALAVLAIPQKGLLKPITGVKISSPKTARADAIAAELAPRLQPGDLVQPLDWTSGALHAMLELKARPATSFLLTYLFHHHVYNPYIKGLRQRFLSEIKASRPRFMIRVDADRPWFVGPLTDMTFPEFDDYLAANYHEIARGDGFVIFEINSSAGGR